MEEGRAAGTDSKPITCAVSPTALQSTAIAGVLCLCADGEGNGLLPPAVTPTGAEGLVIEKYQTSKHQYKCPLFFFTVGAA